jgi:rRNA maturation RNase YbeY
MKDLNIIGVGVNLEINNLASSPVKTDFLKAVAEKTFSALSLEFSEGGKVNISLALVAPEKIRKLNKEYRKFDSVTDILSFPEYENIKEIKKKLGEKTESETFLGELILCYDDIKEYAEENSLELQKELAKTVAHGLLHLLGFKHGKEMFVVQNKILDNLI